MAVAVEQGMARDAIDKAIEILVTEQERIGQLEEQAKMKDDPEIRPRTVRRVYGAMCALEALHPERGGSTQTEIAMQAGVSQSSVSKALKYVLVPGNEAEKTGSRLVGSKSHWTYKPI